MAADADTEVARLALKEGNWLAVLFPLTKTGADRSEAAGLELLVGNSSAGRFKRVCNAENGDDKLEMLLDIGRLASLSG